MLRELPLGRGAVASAGNFSTSCVGDERRVRVSREGSPGPDAAQRQPTQKERPSSALVGARSLWFNPVGLLVVHPGMSCQYLLQPGWLEQILFYSILFYSILFYSILFYSILFYSILFYSILFYSAFGGWKGKVLSLQFSVILR